MCVYISKCPPVFVIVGKILYATEEQNFIKIYTKFLYHKE